MASGYTIFALVCICLLSSVDGHEMNRPCFCSGLNTGKGCNFTGVLRIADDNTFAQENAALGKPTKYSTLYNSEQYEVQTVHLQGCMANNGYTTGEYIAFYEAPQNANCYLSKEGADTQFWEVDLGENYTITEMNIFGQITKQSKKINMTITVDNEFFHKINDSIITSPTQTPIEIKAPPVRGRVVKITKEPSSVNPLSLCEVQIWVCRAGVYGARCEHNCVSSCLDCDNLNGNCWKGCSDGYFGIGCDLKCGYCSDHRCDRNSGQCKSEQCDSGWMGSKCSEGCREGYYGPNCNKQCNKCKNGTVCDSATGKCPAECENGWHGSLCNWPCSSGLYGENCSLQCKNCKELKCHHETGICTEGCVDGFQGEYCRAAKIVPGDKTSPPEENVYSLFIGASIGVVAVTMLAVIIKVILGKENTKGRSIPLQTQTLHDLGETQATIEEETRAPVVILPRDDVAQTIQLIASEINPADNPLQLPVLVVDSRSLPSSLEKDSGSIDESQGSESPDDNKT